MMPLGISGTFNFMIVFQAEHKDVVFIKLGELTGKLRVVDYCFFAIKSSPFPLPRKGRGCVGLLRSRPTYKIRKKSKLLGRVLMVYKNSEENIERMNTRAMDKMEIYNHEYVSGTYKNR